MSKILIFFKTYRLNLVCFTSLFFVSCFFILRAAPEVFGRLGYELHEIANWDTGMYYTIGKGLAHGITPYSGLYENKPPMIFLLSAISYKLTSGYYLVNILSFFSFLTIIVIPAGLWLFKSIKNKTPLISITSLTCTLIYITFIITSFAELRSGEVQIEIFGSAALFLSFLSMSLQKTHTLKVYSPHIIFSGLFLGIATMFKEPFFLLGVLSLFFFVRNRKDLLYHILLPIAYAGLFSLSLLLITGALVPYFTIYLANMFGSHLSIYGSPWDRASNIFRIFDDMRNYSRALEICIYVLFTANVFAFVKQIPNGETNFDKVLSFIKIPWLFLTLYGASFAVGLGGQYYNHHHIFALPLYGILIFNIINYCSSKFSEKHSSLHFVSALIIGILVGLGFADRQPFEVNKNVIREINEAKENAAYIDKILDAIGEKNYAFIGFNGYHPYAYTRHDVIGPSFVQDSHNFTDENTFFSKSLAHQLDSANFIVFRNFNVDVMTPYVIQTLNNCFSKQMPPDLRSIPRPSKFRYDLHFRVKKDCSYFPE